MAAVALACGAARGVARAQGGAATAPSGMTAQMTLAAATIPRDGAARLEVTVVNHGPGDQTLRLDVWHSPVLSVEVYALPAVTRVFTVPPPVPRVNPPTLALHRGESRTFHWTLNVFSPPLPPGTYRVQLRDASFHAAPVEFTVLP